MLKKWICILLAGALLLPAGCKKTEKVGKDVTKIAIITAESGEAFEGARMLAEQKENIVTRTYGGNKSETETVSICTELAKDPAVGAIVFVPAIAGIDKAAASVREIRDDVLFIAGAEPQDAGFVAQTADMVLAQDLEAMGREIVNEAYRMGAKRIIHYSFARHLLSEPVLRRREVMVARCGELGMSFMDITTPDPTTAEGGKEEARQFVEEDVPQQVGDYGANTAFFATDPTIMAELVKQVMECGAILPQTCCGSPFHGYTEMFGIEPAYDNPKSTIGEIAKGIAPYGNTGRMATWTQSADIFMVTAGVRYAEKYLAGEVKKEADMEAMQAVADEISGGMMHFSNMAHAPNCLLFVCDYYML